MEKEIINTVMETALFSGADKKTLEKVLSDGVCSCSFCDEETLTVGNGNEKNLVVILSGKADVFSLDSERKVLIRTLGKGDVFGVAELFAKNSEEVSRVVAKKTCSALFISEEKVKLILEQDKNVMYNYLNFLSCRIRFLNKRIACFTARVLRKGH